MLLDSFYKEVVLYPVEKYLGDGLKLMRELFRVANDLSPTIVFIDNIDAVGSKRYNSSSDHTL